jgi:hypothetical protein
VGKCFTKIKGEKIMKNIFKLLTATFVIGVFCTINLFAQVDAKPVGQVKGIIDKEKTSDKGSGSYLKNGVYIDPQGNAVDSTTCSTGWVLVYGSNPKRWFCRGTHSGSGPLEFGRIKSSGSGYLENGGYFDENGGAVNLTYCSTGWTVIAGTNPVRYSCSGTVFGSGPLALGKSSQDGSGFTESGVFTDNAGKPAEFTYCSTGWKRVLNSNPARWTCAGIVSGSGPLNYPE